MKKLFLLLLTIVTLTFSAYKVQDSDVILTGKLEVNIFDYKNNSETHAYIDTGLEHIELLGVNPAFSNLKSGDYISVRGLKSKDKISVSSLNIQSTTITNTFGEQKILVVLVRFQDSLSDPTTKQRAQDLIFSESQSFFIENSYNQVYFTGDVAGIFILPLNKTCDTGMIWPLADQAANNAGYPISSYERIIYVFPSAGCSWSGSSSVGGSPSRSFINGGAYFADFVVFHELGHAFGLYHAHSLDCGDSVIGNNCVSVEYGDPFDSMGRLNTYYFNAFGKERLGWLDLLNVQEANTSGDYFVSPLETLSSGPMVLKVLKSTNPTTGVKTYYYVECRRPIGRDNSMSNNTYVMNGVLVRQASAMEGYILDMTPLSSSISDSPLEVGQTFIDSANGVSITVNSVSDIGANVSVIVPPPDSAPPSVTITTPINGTIIPVRSTVIINANASDNVAVSRVDFYVDGSLKCSDIIGPYSCSWKASGKNGSSHIIKAVAYDSVGNTAMSQIIVTIG